MRPLFVGLPQLFAASVVLVIGVGTGVDWPWILAIVASLGLVALLQTARAALELEGRRRAADEWLLWGAVARPSSKLLSWRAGELTSPGMRATLAHSLGRVERDTRAGAFPGVPLNRRAIRRQIGLVRALRERLDDQSRPVSARGMLLVDRLVTVPRSPLYSRAPDAVLAEAVSEALTALDPLAEESPSFSVGGTAGQQPGRLAGLLVRSRAGSARQARSSSGANEVVLEGPDRRCRPLRTPAFW